MISSFSFSDHAVSSFDLLGLVSALIVYSDLVLFRSMCDEMLTLRVGVTLFVFRLWPYWPPCG